MTLPIAGGHAGRFRIGDLARLAKKSTRALRLYEELGLLELGVRTEGGHRIYDERALLQISWIDKLQLLGFSLPKIRALLKELSEQATGPLAMERVRAIFREKLEETDHQITQLISLKQELAESLAYLETCNTCDPQTVLELCSDCGHSHAVNETALLQGFHRMGKCHEL